MSKLLDHLTEALEILLGRRGDPMKQAITKQDLVDSGIASVTLNGVTKRALRGASGGIRAINDSAIDYSIPPAPINFIVSGGLGVIKLKWFIPSFSNFGYTEIWRAAVEDLGQATLHATTKSFLYDDPVGDGEVYYYWLRVISASVPPISGPYNSPKGTRGQASYDPAYILQVVTDQIAYSQLHNDLKTEIDLIGTLSGDTAAIQSEVDTLAVSVSGNTAAIQTEQLVRAGAVAGDFSAASSYVVGDTVVYLDDIYYAKVNNGPAAWNPTNWQLTSNLYAQYTVKLDVNGHVAGFGLSAKDNGEGGADSEFIIRANRFALVFPGESWTAATVKDIGAYVLPTTATGYKYKATSTSGDKKTGGSEPTWPTTVSATVVDNNVTWTCESADTPIVPFAVANVSGVPSVVMNTAYIGDATITNLMIDTMVASKIDTGTLTATIGIETTGVISVGNGSTPYQLDIGMVANGAVYDVLKLHNGSTVGFRLMSDGTGYFAGEVQASSGSFTGAVTATSGSFTGAVTAESFYAGDGDESYIEFDDISGDVTMGKNTKLRGADSFNNDNSYIHFQGWTVDCFQTNVVGDGSVSMSNAKPLVYLDTTNEIKSASAYYPTEYYESDIGIWGVPKICKFLIGLVQAPKTDINIYVLMGYKFAGDGTPTQYFTGFKIDGAGAIYGITCNGAVTPTTLSLSYTASSSEVLKLKVDYISSSSVKFYINEVYKGEITTNIPSSGVTYPFSIRVDAPAATANYGGIRIHDIKYLQD